MHNNILYTVCYGSKFYLYSQLCSESSKKNKYPIVTMLIFFTETITATIYTIKFLIDNITQRFSAYVLYLFQLSNSFIRIRYFTCYVHTHVTHTSWQEYEEELFKLKIFAIVAMLRHLYQSWISYLMLLYFFYTL